MHFCPLDCSVFISICAGFISAFSAESLADCCVNYQPCAALLARASTVPTSNDGSPLPPAPPSPSTATKAQQKFGASLYSALPRGKAKEREAEWKANPSVLQLNSTRSEMVVGREGGKLQFLTWVSPRLFALCPLLCRVLLLNSALQHKVGFLSPFPGVQTPTRRALLCRCVGACRMQLFVRDICT